MAPRKHAAVGRCRWQAFAAASLVALHAGSGFVKPARQAVIPERVSLATGLAIGIPSAAGAVDAVDKAPEIIGKPVVYQEEVPANLLESFTQFLSVISSKIQTGAAPETYDRVEWAFLSFGPLVTLYFGVIGQRIASQEYKRQTLLRAIAGVKLKFITEAAGTVPKDQVELGNLYLELKDYSSALAEFDEAEEEFVDNREILDPEDTMGALVMRAKVHVVKGSSLMKLKPPRVAAARREFVRSVTYWPEYPQALVNIGSELIKRKRWDVAVRTLNTALKWAPGSSQIQRMVEQARLAMDGKLDKDEIEDLVTKGGA
mmetsp:Transcript_20341/g.36337  ORF Transcript_20341/g.36337 Transcript_20341/m.36337 type:complete len:316 (+) Transcript_20341:32-979(+)